MEAMNTVRNRLIGAASAVVIGSLMLAGCASGGGGDAGGEEREKLVVAQTMEISSADPANQSNLASGQLVIQYAEPLVYLDDEYNVEPLLAESVERIDDLSYEVVLKEGITFHNGEELKASDVVFSLMRTTDNPQTAARLGDIDPNGFEIIDDQTLIIRTKTPVASFLANLAGPQAAIVSEKAVTELGDDFGTDVTGAGTGPYQFVEWTPGVEIVLEAFDDYWGEPANIERLEYKFVPDANTRTVMLETGEADVVYSVNNSAMGTLSGNDDVTVYEATPAAVRSIFYNQGEGMPFANEDLRKAVSYAIDRDALVEAAYGDAAEVARGYLGPNVLGHNEDIESYELDLDEARASLADAGYGEGELELKLTFWAQNELVRMAEIIQANLAEIGITVTLEQLEASAWVDALANGTVQFGFNGVSSPGGDPDPLMHSHFFSGNLPAPNHGQVNDAELDALLLEGRSTFDRDDRDAIYQQAEALVADHSYAYPLTHEKLVMAARSDLSGFVLDPTNSTRYHTVTATK
ncbi:ABC transporter substrate-binding protein [Agromyces silvae]|uniref:ABC transporter substrate-binding protein n=1 Tax=Agromyces silvae TaxID=3388266 RepID=UPI00280AD3E2|nr:ABC transporter substrate-binding protein [Agromyces protaetiae]